MPHESRRRSWWWPALIVLALVCAGGYVLARAQRLADGPEAIIWDRSACAHCRMLISEPAFAAQLQLGDGQVLDFDDITLFRPQTIGGFERSSRFIQGRSSITNN